MSVRVGDQPVICRAILAYVVLAASNLMET
jgi:hypothetical protein